MEIFTHLDNILCKHLAFFLYINQLLSILLSILNNKKEYTD